MKNLKTKRSNYIKDYLIVNYSKKSKFEITSDLGLSWSYIQKMAHLLNIKREFNESRKSFSLSKLLDGSNKSLYWIGFILADGHLSKSNTLQINLNERDSNHLHSLREYLRSDIKISIKNGIVRCVFTDVPSIIELKKMFSWQSNKTKNPIQLPNLTNEQLFSLIIGFIDGDGSINSRQCKTSLHVKCDKSWREILSIFHFHLVGEYKKFNDVGGCSIFYISKTEKLRDIKRRALGLDLPIMIRKWNKIDLNKVMKYDKSKIVLDLIISGKTLKDIKKLGYSRSLIYSTMKKYYNMVK